MSSTPTPEISVDITFLPTANGGRKGPILAGEYRGVLGVGAEHFSVRFFVPYEDGIAPGESKVFGVQFLVPKIALPLFTPGTRFPVWEGKVIGHGSVREVLAKPPSER
jgi:hypothetical protein